MSFSVIAATPTPPHGDGATRHVLQQTRRLKFACPLLAAGTACISLFAVTMGIAPRTGSSSLEYNLAALSDTWSGTGAQTPVLQRVAFQPAKRLATDHEAVGDEGFWLSRQDLGNHLGNHLGSQAPGFVAIGDRISLAAKTGDAAAAKVSVFEVIELKPLSSAAHLAPPLTIVICREQTTDTATPARTVRFLIETPPAGQTVPVAAPPAAPRNL
jgi:hypothetical protein